MNSYSDAVVKHEGVFTEHFTELGFVGEVAFPTLTDKVENHAVLYAEQLIEAGCPTLKRRPFFQWPPYLDHLAVIGRWTLETVGALGYPIDLIYADLARNVEPRTLNADAAMLEVLPDVDARATIRHAPLRTARRRAHLLPRDDRRDARPCRHAAGRLRPRRHDAGCREGRAIRARSRRGPRAARVEVRVVASNNGRDQSAFLIGCRDLLLGDEYDLVVKLHSKKTPQDAYNVGRHFKRQQFTNLLNSPGYAANVVGLFQREPGLGLVFPPMIHLGYPSLGHGWWANKPGVRGAVRGNSASACPSTRSRRSRRSARCSSRVPRRFGSSSSMSGPTTSSAAPRPTTTAASPTFWSACRPTPPESSASTPARSPTADYIASSYTALDYNLDQMSSTMPETTMHQIQFLRRLGPSTTARCRDFARMYVRLHRPGAEPDSTPSAARLERVRGGAARPAPPSAAVRVGR